MVRPHRCRYADFRSKDDMVALWRLDPRCVPDVDYVVRRDRPLSQQIPSDRYGYIVLAHVLEHIADPIGYLTDLSSLLAPGGVLLVILPDKRRTHDDARPVTPIEHLLNDFHEKATYPSLEHIMQYAPCVIDDLRGKDPGAIYAWARANHATGLADVHCHVWRDEDFFAQADQLVAMGVLGSLRPAGRWHNRGGFNEFMLALRAES
jgi:SAM-dependent methyltransferase